jgi:hypothetical protein
MWKIALILTCALLSALALVPSSAAYQNSPVKPTTGPDETKVIVYPTPSSPDEPSPPPQLLPPTEEATPETEKGGNAGMSLPAGQESEHVTEDDDDDDNRAVIIIRPPNQNRFDWLHAQ